MITSLHPEVYLKSLKMMPTLHQIGEEGCFIYLGRCFPTSVRGNQAYLTYLPILTSLVSGKPFLICVRAMDHSLGALLVQNNNQDTSRQSTTE